VLARDGRRIDKGSLVEYVGAQKTIFTTGRADRTFSLKSLAGRRGIYAVGAMEGLDGEITIFDSQPYVSKMRGAGYVVDHTYAHGAIFLVWTERAAWADVPIPATVKSYRDLQEFVKREAVAAGIDVTKPFPFLLSGTPAEVKWHINVDRTEGKRITPELFATSKISYVLRAEAVDIVGFYSTAHPGVFISQYAPAITPDSGITNAIHMHAVSRASNATDTSTTSRWGPRWCCDSRERSGGVMT
jgi:acetolactate decarboxylase